MKLLAIMAITIIIVMIIPFLVVFFSDLLLLDIDILYITYII